MASMMKKKAKSKQGGKVAVGRTVKVWYIYRFKERYELRDDVRFSRKSPLLFTKDFVGSGTDDESIGFAQQMNILKMRPNRLQLRGAFGELKEIAANRSHIYRGYLLDEKLEPASDKKLALLLGLKVDDAKELLSELEEIGLLERVDVPDFVSLGEDEPKADPKSDEKSDKKVSGKKSGKRKTSGKVASRGNKAGIQSSLCANGNPLYITASEKENSKYKSTSGKSENPKDKYITAKEERISSNTCETGEDKTEAEDDNQTIKLKVCNIF